MSRHPREVLQAATPPVVPAAELLGAPGLQTADAERPIPAAPSMPTVRDGCASRASTVDFDENGWRATRDNRRSLRHTVGHLFGSVGVELTDGKNWPAQHIRVMQDSNGMKARLKQQMYKEPYDVKKLYRETGLAQGLARSDWFEGLTLLVIAINALWISFDADLNNAETLVQAHPVFITMENLFCSYFLFEISVRFSAFKDKKNCLTDAWFVFDSCMVALMIFETWLIPIVILVSGGADTGGILGNVTMIKMLRLLRLSRMARMARLLRSVPELLILVKGMIAALRTVTFSMALLAILLYCFAVAFRMLSEDTTVGNDMFTTVPQTANTLVVMGIFGDSMGELSKGFVEESSSTMGVIMWLAFYVFVLLAVLTVMNMLIGVLCEMVGNVGEQERESIVLQTLREGLLPLVRTSAEESEEAIEISKAEFDKLLHDEPQLSELLHDLDVDIIGMVDCLDSMFANERGREVRLNFGDLMSNILEMRKSALCTVRHITHVRRDFDHMMQEGDGARADDILRLQATIDSVTRLAEKVAKLPEGTVKGKVARQRGLMLEGVTAMRLPQQLGPNSRWRGMLFRLQEHGMVSPPRKGAPPCAMELPPTSQVSPRRFECSPQRSCPARWLEGVSISTTHVGPLELSDAGSASADSGSPAPDASVDSLDWASRLLSRGASLAALPDRPHAALLTSAVPSTLGSRTRSIVSTNAQGESGSREPRRPKKRKINKARTKSNVGGMGV